MVKMADLIDEANDKAEMDRQGLIAAARQPIPIGEPGICRECLEESKRLVGGRCAPCRDL